MKNWKTTIISAVLAVLVALQTVNLAEWKTWLIPVLIVAFGVVAKDYNISGGPPVLLLCGCLLLPGCVSSSTTTTLPDGTIIEQTSSVPNQPAIDAALRAAEMFRENRAVTPDK
jgi:uncharacterized membrane protein